MPCTWIPLSCENALSPMIGLLGGIGMLNMFEINLLVGFSRFVFILVLYPRRKCSIVTTSSSAAFPALSPYPFATTCAPSAPACIADIVFATASPKSLWQCTSIGTLLPMFFLMYFTSSAILSGVITPTVSGMFIMSAPAFKTSL